MSVRLGQIDGIAHEIKPRHGRVVRSKRLGQHLIRHLWGDLIILPGGEWNVIEAEATTAKKCGHDHLEGHRWPMIHMGIFTGDPLSRRRASGVAVSVAMRCEEGIARLIQIEAHSPPKCLRNLLLTAGRSLGDTVRIGKIRAATVCADDAKTLRAMLGHHHLKVADTAADFRDIFRMAFEQSRDVQSIFFVDSLTGR